MKHVKTNCMPLHAGRSGDPNTAFGRLGEDEILQRFGPPTQLLSSSAKMKKCSKVGVLAAVMYLTPGVLCTHATPGCLAACLGHCTGRMQMPTHAVARDRRTALYLARREAFFSLLEIEIWRHSHAAAAAGLTPAVRLNGSSDVPWELVGREIFEKFPEVAFFDYTKSPERVWSYLARQVPKNYHLTFSAAPGNHEHAREILSAGGNVAVVFSPKLPPTLWDYPVVDGDWHDARFLDAPGSVVGLTAKGLARLDLTGFTLRPCPVCGPAEELTLMYAENDADLRVTHRCRACGYQVEQRSAAPASATAA